MSSSLFNVLYIYIHIIKKRKGSFAVVITGNLTSSTLTAEIESWAALSKTDTDDVSSKENIKSHDIMNASKKIQPETTQIASLYEASEMKCKDLNRQLDMSARRIAELEQALHRERFQNNKISEELKYERKKSSDQSEEFRLQSDQWMVERQALLDESLRDIKELTDTVKALEAERDTAREKLRRGEVNICSIMK